MASSDSSSALGFPAAGASSGTSDPKSLELSSNTEDEHVPTDVRGRPLLQPITTLMRMTPLMSPRNMPSSSSASHRATSNGGYGKTTLQQKRDSPTQSRSNSAMVSQRRTVQFDNGRPPLQPRTASLPPAATDAELAELYNFEQTHKKQKSDASPPSSWT